MNIEEAIKDIKRIINNPEFDYIVLMDSQGFTEWNEILETLLTAYEKEKEKNQNAIQELINNDYISKDKIKAKIEEVEQWGLYNMKIPRLSTLDERLGAKIGIKYVLQSLLEKE